MSDRSSSHLLSMVLTSLWRTIPWERSGGHPDGVSGSFMLDDGSTAGHWNCATIAR